MQEITGVTELYDPTGAGTWTQTASLITARTNHTATLLSNGKVLVAGGIAPYSINSAEIYDPVAKRWTATGNLNVARNSHAATLLPSGQVLVVGGLGPSNVPQNTAEFYDPTTGAWTQTPNMSTAHGSPSLALLPNGLVLVAGGDSTGKVCELYDPSANTWTTTGSLNAGHQGDPTTTLLTGSVLIASKNPEIYNPMSGTWRTASTPGFAVTGATATLLPVTSLSGTPSGGQVLLAGGDGTNSNYFDSGLNYGVRPNVNAVVTSLNATNVVDLFGTGMGTNGASEGSGGTSNNSASNIPVVQLHNLNNGQMETLTLDPNIGFSSTLVQDMAPGSFQPGYTVLTLIINGTPSIPQIVSFTETQSVSNLPSMQSLIQDASPVTFPATAPDGETITYTVSGPATVSGDKVTLTGSGTVIVTAKTAGNSTYAPVSQTDTLTVTPPHITDTPVMPPWALVTLALLLLGTACRFPPAKLLPS
jgi:hypothetical protein